MRNRKSSSSIFFTADIPIHRWRLAILAFPSSLFFAEVEYFPDVQPTRMMTYNVKKKKKKKKEVAAKYEGICIIFRMRGWSE